MKIEELNKAAIVKIILSITPTNTYALQLSKITKITYSHISTVTKFLEKNNIIITEKIGRLRVIKLTKKGEKIRDCYCLINTIISEEDKEPKLCQ